MRTLFLALAALVAASSAAPAAAQQTKREQELLDIQQRLKDRREDERRLKDEASARAKEVSALRYRMIETANALQDSEKRMSDIRAELDRLGGEEAEVQASLLVEQETLGDVLAALQSLELAKPPALLVSPDDANKAARAAILLADAAPAVEARARTLRVNLERLEAIRTERDKERAAFEKTREDISARRTVLAELLTKKQAESDVAASLAAAAQRETAALAARETSLQGVIRSLKRLARSVTPRIKPPKTGTAMAAVPSAKPNRRPDVFAPARPFQEARGALRPPVVGRLTGSFGTAKPEGGRFDGVRFTVPDQAIVTAPYEANVAFARAWNPIGNLIVLDVGGGYHILLMGVSAFLVQEGQRVTAGEPLGAMSAETGSEANLDLEIRKNGEPVNPVLWLSKKSIEEMAF